MIPRREEFILDVWRAARLEAKPIMIANSELIKPDSSVLVLRRSARWLTPTVVEKYHPSDFTEFANEKQEALGDAVAAFRALTETGPASSEDYLRGSELFHRLVASVKAIVLAEWREAVEAVIQQAETWAGELGWKVRRETKELTETLLDTYQVPQLLIYAGQHLYVLDPQARFVPGGLGSFDLSIQPSYYATTIYRDYAGVWQAHLEVSRSAIGGRREAWAANTFRACLQELQTLL